MGAHANSLRCEYKATQDSLVLTTEQHYLVERIVNRVIGANH